MTDTILEMDLFQTRVVRRALKRLRWEVRKTRERNLRIGWQPEPGRVNAADLQLAAIETLLARLPTEETGGAQ